MVEPVSIIAISVASIVAIAVGIKQIISIIHKDPDTGNLSIRSSCCNLNNESEVQQGMRRNSSDIGRLAERVHNLDEKKKKKKKRKIIS